MYLYIVHILLINRALEVATLYLTNLNTLELTSKTEKSNEMIGSIRHLTLLIGDFPSFARVRIQPIRHIQIAMEYEQGSSIRDEIHVIT